MLRRVVQTIERYGMFAPGDRVGIAVSGGADSVCLLNALLELAPKWDLALHVLHVNHNLRGDASRADAEFVRALAAAHRFPFTLHDLDLSSPGNLEQNARNGRLAFFHAQLATGAVSRIALGHTRSDQAETVLFRFLRGSGATGLAAIRPVTPEGLVRPLLDIDRAEVESYLRERGIPWREDATNASPDFARNRIRHHLLPQLAREWNPALVEALAHTAELSSADEVYWQEEIGRFASQYLTHKDGAVLAPASGLTGLPIAVARRLVRRAVHVLTGDNRGIDFHHVAAVLELAGQYRGTGRVQIHGVEVLRSFDWLRFASRSPAQNFGLCVSVPGRVRIPGTNLCISLEMLEKSETSPFPEHVYNSQMGCIDWNRLSGPLALRNWQPGDQYQPVGVPAAKKIKTLFQQARIPVWERTQWPVLTDAESIIWARRFGAAAAVAASKESSKILAVSEVEIR